MKKVKKINEHLVRDAEKILADVQIVDSAGDTFFYNENWVLLNQCLDEVDLGTIIVSGNWRSSLIKLRSRYSEEDQQTLLDFCEDGEWPQVE